MTRNHVNVQQDTLNKLMTVNKPKNANAKLKDYFGFVFSDNLKDWIVSPYRQTR